MIHVFSETEDSQPQAETIAAALSLSISTSDALTEPHTFLLRVSTERLSLQWCDETGTTTKPFYVDFSSDEILHRAQHPHIKGETLVRAVGIKGDQPIQVLDATAGLGRDAFILASAGAVVTMCERSPVLALLLGSALTQLKEHEATHTIKLSLIQKDATQFLSDLASDQRPDVVYCDPMFPQRTKSALVKKEMRALRDLLGPDSDAAALLSAGLNAARRHLVVKRPLHAEVLTIDGKKPTGTWAGKSCRFDRY